MICANISNMWYFRSVWSKTIMYRYGPESSVTLVANYLSRPSSGPLGQLGFRMWGRQRAIAKAWRKPARSLREWPWTPAIWDDFWIFLVKQRLMVDPIDSETSPWSLVFARLQRSNEQVRRKRPGVFCTTGRWSWYLWVIDIYLIQGVMESMGGSHGWRFILREKSAPKERHRPWGPPQGSCSVYCHYFFHLAPGVFFLTLLVHWSAIATCGLTRRQLPPQSVDGRFLHRFCVAKGLLNTELVTGLGIVGFVRELTHKHTNLQPAPCRLQRRRAKRQKPRSDVRPWAMRSYWRLWTDSSRPWLWRLWVTLGFPKECLEGWTIKTCDWRSLFFWLVERAAVASLFWASIRYFVGFWRGGDRDQAVCHRLLSSVYQQ